MKTQIWIQLATALYATSIVASAAHAEGFKDRSILYLGSIPVTGTVSFPGAKPDGKMMASPVTLDERDNDMVSKRFPLVAPASFAAYRAAESMAAHYKGLLAGDGTPEQKSQWTTLRQAEEQKLTALTYDQAACVLHMRTQYGKVTFSQDSSHPVMMESPATDRGTVNFRIVFVDSAGNPRHARLLCHGQLTSSELMSRLKLHGVDLKLSSTIDEVEQIRYAPAPAPAKPTGYAI